MLSIFILCWREDFLSFQCLHFSSVFLLMSLDLPLWFWKLWAFFFLPLNFCCIFPAMPSCNQEIEEVGPALSVCPSISVFTCPTACFTPLSCFSLLFSSHIYQYSFVAYCHHVTLLFCFAVMARHMNQTVKLKSFLTAISFWTSFSLWDQMLTQNFQWMDKLFHVTSSSLVIPNQTRLYPRSG